MKQSNQRTRTADDVKRRLIRKIVVFVSLALVFMFLCILRGNEQIAEAFTRTVSRAWVAVSGTLFSWIPCSIYELFLIVAILAAICAVVFIIVALCKKKFVRVFSLILSIGIFAFAFLSVYTTSASFAYDRAPLPKAVYSRQNPESFTREQAIDMAANIVKATNEAYRATEHDENGNIVLPSIAEIRADLAEEYKRFDEPLYEGYFSSYDPAVKKIVNSRIMSEMHIVGVFFAPTGEANINGVEQNFNLPHTMAHEMAHGKGVMRENEANLVASYLLLTSSKPYLRYSALMKVLNSAISLAGMYPDTNDTVKLLSASIDRGILAERSNYNKLWSQFTLVGDIGDWFNDLYLKFNKQTGSDSYYKPGQSEDTDQKDNDGEIIKIIVSFSDTQDLLVMLYNRGVL